MMFWASSGETIFVKSFSKVPTFTAYHLWVSFSLAAMNVTVSRWPLKSPPGSRWERLRAYKSAAHLPHNLVQNHSCEPCAVLDRGNQTRGGFADVVPRQADGGDYGSGNDKCRGEPVTQLPLALL